MATESAKKDIRNFLAVIFFGVLCAALVAFFMLSYYGASGQYTLKQVLLSPKLLKRMSYNDRNSKTGGTSKYLFDHIELSYFSPQEKKWEQEIIPEKHYKELYKIMRGDQSIVDPSAEIEGMFVPGSIATLQLFVRTESRAPWQAETKAFQKVQFVDGQDLFRVELHDQEALSSWAYFHHPEIYKKMIQTLLPQQ